MAVTRGCGCSKTPTDIRFTSDGMMEVSTDGGETWVPATSVNDPRLAIPLAPPLPGDDGETKRCNAAAAGVAYLMNMQADLSAQLGAGIGLTALGVAIGIILVAILSGGTALVLIALFAPLAIALVGVTSAAFDAAFDADVWDRLLCNLFCNASDDGSFSLAGWQLVKLGVLADESGLAERFLYDIINTMGHVGLTNAMRSNPDAVGDCGDCVCVGGCDLDNWDTYPGGNHGVVVSRDEETGVITLSTTTIQGGQYYIGLQTSDPINLCCYTVDIQTAGGFVNTWAIWPCGSAIDYGNLQIVPIPINQCLALVQAQSDAPFTMTITLATCP